MNTEVNEYFDILLSVCRAEHIPLSIRYKQMRDLLERLCREQIENQNLQMTDLSARISFVAAKVGLSVREQNRLHTFRLTSNAILNRQEEASTEKLLRDAKTLAFFVRKLHGHEIPRLLYRLLPQADATYIVAAPGHYQTQRMRVCFQYADEQYLYVTPTDSITDEPLRVRYNVPQINEEFKDTVEILWRHAQINLLDVSEDEEGILTPSFIVLEPDYLIDISSLAECYKDYGHHPANYHLNKLQPIENARPLLLGNIANLFLDEWIHASGEVDYKTCMQKAFRQYPIELAACKDLRDREKEIQFFSDCKLHFDHIRQTVTETFQQTGYKLDKTDAVLEPSYMCEALGLQGRLDYMQRDMHSFIEMKSGKADEYTLRNRIEPKENNKVQMLLYQAVLQYSMGIDHRQINAYLLYTRYPLLYPARSSWAMVRRAINLRNRIVADEYGIQLRNNIEYTRLKLAEINAQTLNEKKLQGRFWEQYLKPSIDQFAEKLNRLNPQEKAYFYTLYNFITKEQYTSKSGDAEYEGRTGSAALWLSTFTEKCESGEILYDLTIKENHAADEHKAHVILTQSVKSPLCTEGVITGSLPNFRQGDTIVLYERNSDSDNVTNKMVFKGNIEAITEEEVTVRLRATQHNTAILPPDSFYAIEHDSMDTGFRCMFLGLSAFASANQDRRDLLLAARPPETDNSHDAAIAHAENDFVRVALKAKAAKDYFLLVGPPGTGKTSRALRTMVEMFHQEGETQILLLSYTNRAVDEICKALLSINPCVDFIRVGNELSCEPPYRPYLIENVLATCTRRSEVTERISRCRIFIGTVATLSNKPELFRLKRFDVAIIDEATQILEPQLLPILCARSEDGNNAIGKFILIGDHKQLPAVVLQNTAQTEVIDESLRSIGLLNLKDSLFERLYRSLQLSTTNGQQSAVSDMLCKQGRMHPEVAYFPNQAFYQGSLESLGLPHQTEKLSKARVSFFASQPESAATSGKINLSEAHIASLLTSEIVKQYGESFDPCQTLGIITPYRSQIAQIKAELRKLQISALEHILIDTVERFQGSERDVIIYSFCLSHPYQLKFLSNTIEDNGALIDRKLNVALTRARKQLYIIGVPEILRLNSIYANLLKLINR